MAFTNAKWYSNGNIKLANVKQKCSFVKTRKNS